MGAMHWDDVIFSVPCTMQKGPKIPLSMTLPLPQCRPNLTGLPQYFLNDAGSPRCRLIDTGHHAVHSSLPSSWRLESKLNKHPLLRSFLTNTNNDLMVTWTITKHPQKMHTDSPPWKRSSECGVVRRCVCVTTVFPATPLQWSPSTMGERPPARSVAGG